MQKNTQRQLMSLTLLSNTTQQNTSNSTLVIQYKKSLSHQGSVTQARPRAILSPE